MSSGERVKPPVTYEERNPFDISRRSEKEVAAEIAQRMVAWKQARGRSYATPSTVPSAEAKLPPVSAPVQPTRLPKFGEHAVRPPQPASQPTDAPLPRQTESPTPQRAPAEAAPADAGNARTRAPLFASISAMRRAMPPAPSLKQPTPPQPPIETPRIYMPEVEAREVAALGPEASAPERAEVEHADVAAVSEAPSADAPIAEVRETEIAAAAAKARDSEVPGIDTPAAAVGEAEPVAPVAPAVDVPDSDVQRVEAQVDTPVAEERASEPAAPEAPAIEERDVESLRTEARNIRARWMEAHDIDAPLAEARETEPAAAAAPEIEPAIAAGDREADRIEARDTHVRRIDVPLVATRDSDLTTPAPEAVDDEIEVSERREPTLGWPTEEKREIEAAAPAPPAGEAPNARPRIDLPRIETRIESRRIETLRADPQMVGRRPIFPHIEPEEWDIPPVVAARANQARGGTGWAIGLGAVLLIIGITAPAAIWQQGRHALDQDQAMLNPAPMPPAKPASEATTGTPAQPTVEATLPEAPQPEAPPPSAPPAVQAANPPAPAAQPEVGAPAPEEQTALSAVGDGGEVNEAPITTPPAPILDLASTPKTQPTPATGETPETPMFPPVARAFVPDPALSPAPFLRAPVGATVAVDSAALQAPAGATVAVDEAAAIPGAEASIALRPSLMGQLKPQPTNAPAVKTTGSVPQKSVRRLRPYDPRSLDQMFQNLIDTLSEGKPVNPATKPLPPSNRR